MRLTGDQKFFWKFSKKIGIFFSIFSQTGTVEEKTWHFEVLLLFLSLRYGADLGFVRLFANISKGSTLHFFVYFAKEWMLKNSQRAPFYMFRHYATYGWPKIFLKIFKKNWNFFSIFSQTGTVEEKTWHFEVLLLFLSLRYGADLGRSRLVHSPTIIWNNFPHWFVPAVMIHWTMQLKEVVYAQDSQEITENSGPLEEIEFWRSRCVDLSSISTQLDKPEVKRIESILEMVKSSYVGQFRKYAQQIQVSF